MLNVKMHILVTILIATVLTGCAPVTTSVTASCFTQPVLLGKIKRIDAVEEKQRNLRVPFNIERRSGDRTRFVKFRFIFEENGPYPELYKLVESPHDEIVVHEVIVRSRNGWMAGVGGAVGMGTDIRTVINGGIYREGASGE